MPASLSSSAPATENTAEASSDTPQQQLEPTGSVPVLPQLGQEGEKPAPEESEECLAAMAATAEVPTAAAATTTAAIEPSLEPKESTGVSATAATTGITNKPPVGSCCDEDEDEDQDGTAIEQSTTTLIAVAAAAGTAPAPAIEAAIESFLEQDGSTDVSKPPATGPPPLGEDGDSNIIDGTTGTEKESTAAGTVVPTEAAAAAVAILQTSPEQNESTGVSETAAAAGTATAAEAAITPSLEQDGSTEVSEPPATGPPPMENDSDIIESTTEEEEEVVAAGTAVPTVAQLSRAATLATR